jgi:hypothetical protein
MGFRAWLVGLLLASAAGYGVTVLTAPASTGHDPFDSPLLLPAIAVLGVLCGVAGWQEPRGGFWWGVVVAVPYLVGLWVQSTFFPGEGASLVLLGYAILVFLLLVPWLAGVVASLARRR